MQAQLTQGTVTHVPAIVPTKYQDHKPLSAKSQRALDAAGTPKKLTMVDVAKNPATGEIEPTEHWADSQAKTLYARHVAEMEQVFTPKIVGTPTIDDPALTTVEPMTPNYVAVTTWKRIAKAPAAKPAAAPKARVNAPFASTGIIRVLVAANPKKVGSAAYTRFATYVNGQTVAQALAADKTMADFKYDVAHGFIKVERV